MKGPETAASDPQSFPDSSPCQGARSIPHPPPAQQQEIIAILDAIDRKIDLHRRKRAVLDDLFKTLLHKLMTREIRIADLSLSAL